MFLQLWMLQLFTFLYSIRFLYGLILKWLKMLISCFSCFFTTCYMLKYLLIRIFSAKAVSQTFFFIINTANRWLYIILSCSSNNIFFTNSIGVVVLIVDTVLTHNTIIFLFIIAVNQCTLFSLSSCRSFHFVVFLINFPTLLRCVRAINTLVMYSCQLPNVLIIIIVFIAVTISITDIIIIIIISFTMKILLNLFSLRQCRRS